MFYIAYGSNLNISQMAHRCPAAKRIGRIDLPDTRLVFRGVADVVPDRGHVQPCGLWRITAACERALDVYEGVKGGFYWKDYVELTVNNEPAGKALIYRMTCDDDVYPPSSMYFDVVARGFSDFGLPTESLYEARRRSGRVLPTIRKTNVR